jgi:hypothetical protein
MVLFTVKRGRLPSGLEVTPSLPIEFAVYLNVLGIVILAGPSEHFSNIPSQEGPTAFGVDAIKELPPYEESELDVEDEPFL